MRVKARLWEALDGKKVRCLVCNHKCIISEGKKGICRVRENEDGELYTLIYGSLTAEAVDPIEKKPLFHFYPNSETYSISTVSCNFQCPWCQNWHLVASNIGKIHTWDVTPEEIVEKTLRLGLRSISYTYNEPTIWYEFIYDAGKLAKEKGIDNVLVTNGYYSLEALEDYSKFIDAANIDIKGFNEGFYRRYPKASLEKTLETALETHRRGIHVELTMLIIPELNDKPEEIRGFITWILDAMGPDVPVHFSRFFPHYKFTHLPPTPIQTLERAYRMARDAGIRYVYLGNIPGAYEDTYCPGCGAMVIKRNGYMVTKWLLDGHNQCQRCGERIAIRGGYTKKKRYWPF